MLYRIDFLDNNDTPSFGYIEAVSPYWARLQFENEYPFEIVGVEEYRCDIDEDAILL